MLCEFSIAVVNVAVPVTYSQAVVSYVKATSNTSGVIVSDVTSLTVTTSSILGALLLISTFNAGVACTTKLKVVNTSIMQSIKLKNFFIFVISYFNITYYLYEYQYVLLGS